MIKKLSLFAMFLVVIIGLVACDSVDNVTKLAFEDLKDGYLEKLEVNVKTKTTQDDFLGMKDVVVNIADATVVVNLNGFDYNVVGSYEISYTATDKDGNVATAKRKVDVVDKIAPYFEYASLEGVLPASQVLQYSDVDLLNFEYLNALDNYDTELEVKVKDNGGFNKDVAGEYTITYSATDSSGNEGVGTKKLTVVPAVVYIEDVIKIGENTHAASIGEVEKLNDEGSGMLLRFEDKVFVYTKAEYDQAFTDYQAAYAKNGGAPYLPWGIAVILDKDFKVVRVRNAAYAIEAVLLETGEYDLLKGQDLTFIDSTTPSNAKVGILGGGFETFIPEGGYVLLCGSPFGGNLDTAKIFLASNLLATGFTGGALTWDLVEGEANDLLKAAKVSIVEDSQSYYPKPDDMPAPVISVVKHVLTWEEVAGAGSYDVYKDGEFYLNVTKNSLALAEQDLVAGTKYVFEVVAKSKDIRYYGDSPKSNAVEYTLPNATKLTAPTITLTDSVLTFTLPEGATGIQLYAKQVDVTDLGTFTAESIDLATIDKLNSLVYNAYIYGVALGDQIETLDSDPTNQVVYNCSAEKLLVIGDASYPVIETTVEDYFPSRRNLTTEIGYSGKSFLYYITDAYKLVGTTYNEAFGFIVVIDKEGVVKSLINILATLDIYINYQWVTPASVGYTNNNAQIAPLLATLAEGDKMIIGRQSGTMSLTLDGTGYNVFGRDILAHHFWGAFTASNTSANQPWRSAHTITTYPTVSVKNAHSLSDIVLSVEGTKVSWEAIDKASSYEIYLDDVLVDTITKTEFDLLDYVTSFGKTGASGTNVTSVNVAVKALSSDPKLSDSAKAKKTLSVETVLSDGTNELKVNVNVKSILYNSGSGAACRLTDAVSSLVTGSVYKAALKEYVTNTDKYNNNAKIPFMQNGVIIVLSKDMKVKQIRYGFVKVAQIDGDYNVTAPTTWNNNTVNATTGGGNFLNLDQEISDDDFILIITNAGSKVQLTQAVLMFVNTNTNALINTRLAVDDESIKDTKVDLANTNYSVVYKVSAE